MYIYKGATSMRLVLKRSFVRTLLWAIHERSKPSNIFYHHILNIYFSLETKIQVLPTPFTNDI